MKYNTSLRYEFLKTFTTYRIIYFIIAAIKWTKYVLKKMNTNLSLRTIETWKSLPKYHRFCQEHSTSLQSDNRWPLSFSHDARVCKVETRAMSKLPCDVTRILKIHFQAAIIHGCDVTLLLWLLQVSSYILHRHKKYHFK